MAAPAEEFEEDAPDEMLLPIGALPDVSGKSLDEVLGGAGETFQQRLFKLIDASGIAAEGGNYDMDIEPDDIEVSDTVTVLWEIA